MVITYIINIKKNGRGYALKPRLIFNLISKLLIKNYGLSFIFCFITYIKIFMYIIGRIKRWVMF